MATIVYNPKTFEGRPSQPINYLWERKRWKLGVNKIAKFPDHIAEQLLKNYGYLEEVEPEDLDNVKKRMAEKKYKCQHCDAEFETDKQLKGHELGKHKLSKENKEALKDIPEAEVEGTQYQKVAQQKQTAQSIEEQEGIGGESEGWYGAGLEDDAPMQPRKSTF